jgi:hypothetical protein
MAKIKGKSGLLKNLKAIKGEGLRVEAQGPKQVTRADLAAGMRQAGVPTQKARTWIYKPTDLVRVKDWRFGTFVATVIGSEDEMVTVMGPMGLVIVSPRQIQLVDRYDDPVPPAQDEVE